MWPMMCSPLHVRVNTRVSGVQQGLEFIVLLLLMSRSASPSLGQLRLVPASDSAAEASRLLVGPGIQAHGAAPPWMGIFLTAWCGLFAAHEVEITRGPA